MTLQPSPAAFELEGVFNFRDFGGAPTADGGAVRRGLLYRSAHHAAASEADLARLAELGLALIVDLRRAPERQRAPSRRPADFCARVLEHDGPTEAEALAPHLEFLTHPDAGPEWITERMITGYRSYPFDPAYAAIYRDYFQALAELDGAVLIHCHAGKDRTGVLVALTLHTLGVAPGPIFEDYLVTNRMNRADERIADLTRGFELDHGRSVDEALLRHVLTADARYLEAAFDEMAQRHGGVDGYLEEVLGVTPAVRGKLRERLVEPIRAR